jgi:diguanylate cyclase (GGDEF)-like protein
MPSTAIDPAREQGLPSQTPPPVHPRVMGWGGTAALAMGGSNQMLFLIGALVMSQSSAAIPLLAIGLLLSWAALPGWIELVMMWPNRVGGIAATCAEAFRPYSPVLANLAGMAYWWGWIPTCGLTAILSASALHQLYLPGVPVSLLATLIVVLFTGVNLAGVKWAAKVAIPIAIASASLALLSAVLPMLSGSMDWGRGSSFHLETPFGGFFGAMTSAMAGLYLIGFAAPAFEAAACHVGETKDPERNVPRAMFAAAGMATIYFVVLPVIWLGTLGAGPLEHDLIDVLGPTFAPLFGAAAGSAAIWFMVLNMFHGTLQPLAGASRTIYQLAEDGLLPRIFGRRSRRDVPWVATLLTAGLAILFLQSGNPVWVIAAANFCYLIGIGLPSVAVWLLRRNAPEMKRPYRAPRGTVTLGVVAAACWFVATVLGFEQFGLPTVLFSLTLAFSGSLLYAWRRSSDRRRAGLPRVERSLHMKLTGAMVAVLVLDGAGYLLAVSYVDASSDPALVSVLQDIFVAVAILTVTVGLVLPGMIAHAAEAVTGGAERLARGTIADLTRAMQALSQGDLDRAHARSDVVPVVVHTRDELGAMATSFNEMQVELGHAAEALDGAREGLSRTEKELERHVAQQAAVARLGERALEGMEIGELMEEITRAVRFVLGVPVAAVDEVPEDRAAGKLATAAREPPTVESTPDGLSVPVPTRSRPYFAVRVSTDEPHDFASERARAEDDMRHHALHDPLTGLPNRTLFADRLGVALHGCARSGSTVAVLFLDLDQFKLVNDSFGHSTGDELLRGIAARLDESLRGGDTVARFGGDEFVIICEQLAGAAEAVVIAERTLAALGRPFALHGREHFVSASMGIAVAQAVVREPEDLIREADAAMYRSKERGPGRYELYDEVMRSRAIARLRIENDLRRGIEAGELTVHYQPIVSLSSRMVVGVEALVRWRHVQRGLLGPKEFIHVAEQTGLIIPMGKLVLQQACTQAAGWMSRGATEPFHVSVNLSLRQVADPTFPEMVAQTLESTGLDPGALSLEITESVLMDDPETSVEVLDRIKALGVDLVLDDFGTGYSSLAYVQRFPIDVLKIDRSFVLNLGQDDEDRTIVETIVSMARGLRVGVIAEGVETAAQAGALSEMGCPMAQGYHYSRPLPASRIEELLGAELPPSRALA